MIYQKDALTVISSSTMPWRKKIRYVLAEIYRRAKSSRKRPPPNRRKAKNRHQNRGYAVEEMQQLSSCFVWTELRLKF
jgi:hypothetical protein